MFCVSHPRSKLSHPLENGMKVWNAKFLPFASNLSFLFGWNFFSAACIMKNDIIQPWFIHTFDKVGSQILPRIVFVNYKIIKHYFRRVKNEIIK